MTSRGLHKFETVQTCKQCHANFQERWNVGRLMCRMHPRKAFLPRTLQYTCCEFPVGEPAYAATPGLRTEDRVGCLPCDHSALDAAEAPVVSVFPEYYLKRGFITDCPRDSIMLTVTADTVRDHLKRGSQRLLFAVPAFDNTRQVQVDIVNVAFQLLINFIASDYYGDGDEAFRRIRLGFEELIDEVYVVSEWNPIRDTVDSSTERISDIDTREMLASTALDRQFSHPDRSTRHLPAVRITLARAMRDRNDTEKLLRAFVPFVIVRRQGMEQDQLTLKTIQHFNKQPVVRRQYNIKMYQYTD